MFRKRALSLLVPSGICLFMTGCERYRAKPLLPVEVVEAVQSARLELEPLDPASSNAPEATVAPGPFTFPRTPQFSSAPQAWRGRASTARRVGASRGISRGVSPAIR